MAVAIGVMNVAIYAATLLAARLLGPKAYGGFAAVTGLLLVVGVVMLGLQTTGARRVAASPGHVSEIERSLMRVSYRAAWVLAGVCLLLTPVFDTALHLQSTATAAIVALAVWPMTLVGGEAGILQGERRWVPLAGVYLSMGVARIAATMLLLWKPEEWVAALSMAIGFAAPAFVGWLALRRFAHLRSQESSGHHHERTILREVGANSHALLAFFALSNADVILSRFVLDTHSSGLYAGGLILVKSLLFLPQFVIVVAFPSMSTQEARRATLVKSVALILALGARRDRCGVGAQRVGTDLHRRVGVLRHPGPAVGLRSARDRAVDRPAPRLQRGGPAVAAVGVPDLGRPGGARARSHPGGQRHRHGGHGVHGRHGPDARAPGAELVAPAPRPVPGGAGSGARAGRHLSDLRHSLTTRLH